MRGSVCGHSRQLPYLLLIAGAYDVPVTRTALKLYDDMGREDMVKLEEITADLVQTFHEVADMRAAVAVADPASVEAHQRQVKILEGEAKLRRLEAERQTAFNQALRACRYIREVLKHPVILSDETDPDATPKLLSYTPPNF